MPIASLKGSMVEYGSCCKLIVLLSILSCQSNLGYARHRENCGVAAFKYVIDGYGITHSTPEADAIGEKESISLMQMRSLFEAEGLAGESFVLSRRPSRRLTALLNRLAKKDCQVILLLPVTDERRTDVDVPGHYFVVDNWGVEVADLIVPHALSFRTVDLSKLVASKEPVAIQFVFRPYDQVLYAPVGL